MSKNKIKWEEHPEDDDYPAALSYLTLIYTPARAKQLVEALRKAKTVKFYSKDIFRASGLTLRGVSTKYVKKQTKKIKRGEALNPILLVRDDRAGEHLVVADGYHRLCAVYHFDENEKIPCRIV